ncbi:MAG: N-acyl homoserine lactonase family protein [Pseudomonadota bacterium]
MKKNNQKIFGVLASAMILIGCDQPVSPNAKPTLFALDCGAIDFDDMTSFSNDGRFDRQSYSLVVPCFLIRHPDGDLLWDTGLNRKQFGVPGGVSFQGIHSRVTVPLIDQLEVIGLQPKDIEYVSVSHSHPDHIGNADLFDQSTFIVSADEFEFMFSDAMRTADEYFQVYAHLEDAHMILYADEYDVFGDGTVRMLQLPGHTPGSAILMLELERSGTILLTGDLITHTAGREAKAIPTFNTDAEQTRTSIDKFEALAAAENARVIIQHEPNDFEALPRFPQGLD